MIRVLALKFRFRTVLPTRPGIPSEAARAFRIINGMRKVLLVTLPANRTHLRMGKATVCAIVDIR